MNWTWVNERYRGRLPEGFSSTIMSVESQDRHHEKQGRSTARVVFHAGNGGPESPARPVSVYLKRHYRLPWTSRLAATLNPSRPHSPAAAEWAHLERARALGVEVPDVVAAGEQIGPHAGLSSFLMVAELTGCEALNEVLPRLADRSDGGDFADLKRRVISEVARIAATLHRAHYFHKDLYLCHFFLDLGRLESQGRPSRIVLIDLHRLGVHRILRDWWRWKDLGQLLFSTYGIDGIADRDRLRFWYLYKKQVGIPFAGWQARLVRFRAARYGRHNRKRR